MKGFLPDGYFHDVTGITPEYLEKMGISALFLDIDNTLTRQDDPVLPEAVRVWLEGMKAAGIEMVVFSNNDEARVSAFASKIALPYVAGAAKPLPFGMRRHIRASGMVRHAVAAVGDQFFTDLLGAKATGIRFLLVDPMEEETSGFLKCKRAFQNKWLKRHRLQPQNQEESI